MNSVLDSAYSVGSLDIHLYYFNRLYFKVNKTIMTWTS